MSKADCDRVHNAQKDIFNLFASDSKRDRDALWDKHNELVNSINELVKSMSARAIQMLIAIILGLAAFIGSNIYLAQNSSSTKMSDDIQTLTSVVTALVKSQVTFHQEYENISGDNNKMLKEMEKKK